MTVLQLCSEFTAHYTRAPPRKLASSSQSRLGRKYTFFFCLLFSPFQKCGGPVRRKSRFLNRNSGGGSDQREYVAHCSNGSFNVRFTIMFIGACVAEGDKAMDTLWEQAVVDRSVLEKKRNLFFAVHIGQELFGLTVDWQIEKDIKLVCVRNITASQDTPFAIPDTWEALNEKHVLWEIVFELVLPSWDSFTHAVVLCAYLRAGMFNLYSRCDVLLAFCI